MQRSTAALAAAIAALALAAAPAGAAGKWAPQRCNKAYASYLRQHHINRKHATKRQAQQVVKYLRGLNKQHRCGFKV